MNSDKKLNVKKELNEHDSEFGEKLTKQQKKVASRRQKIFFLLVRGTTNSYQIAEEIGISQSTVSRDIQFLKAKAVEEMSFHIHERLPMEYKICSHGITEVLRHAWGIILNENSKANKTATLTLIAELYKTRLQMATDAFVISDALAALEGMKNQILGFVTPNLAHNDSRLLSPTMGAIK